jgi:hypothetical protein
LNSYPPKRAKRRDKVDRKLPLIKRKFGPKDLQDVELGPRRQVNMQKLNELLKREGGSSLCRRGTKVALLLLGVLAKTQIRGPEDLNSA